MALKSTVFLALKPPRGRTVELKSTDIFGFKASKGPLSGVEKRLFCQEELLIQSRLKIVEYLNVFFLYPL